MRFNTEDNLILQGVIYRPVQPTKNAYLHIHGMGGNFYENRFLDVMAHQLTEAGFAFVSINTRGHDTIADFPLVGEKEVYKRIGNAFEIFEECLFDIKAAINHLQKEGFGNIVLGGHSLGAVKVAYYVAEAQDDRISRLVLMSPPDMISLAEVEDDASEFLRASQQMIKEGRGDELLPKKLWDGYYLSAKTYLNLSTRDLPVDIFNIYDESKPSSLGKITIPALALLGEHDDAVTIPQQKALEIIKQKATSASKFDIKVIPKANHGYFGREEEMTKAIVDWLHA